MNLKILKYPLLLFPLVVFTGCSLWSNFVTYFNIYYNASNAFDEAEDLIKSQERDLFSPEPVAVPGTAAPLLTKVIEKSSKILQYYSETSFVDEAIMMLGKSFYYQRDYLKALRKFSELIATQPESEFVLEARLWIAKTQMMMKNYEEALPLLETVRAEAIEEGEDEFVREAFIEEVVYKIQTEKYQEAIKLASDFLEVSDDEEINAMVAYELGKLYVTTGDNEAAVAAFSRVYDYAPSYDLDYKANIELGRALRNSGKTEEALELFTDMRSEDKYRDKYDEIDLERGITLSELDRPEEAITALTEVDTAYQTSINSGIARLKIGEIYEKKLLNYDSATVYYTKAAGSQAPPEYLLIASAKNKLFTKYNTTAASLRENNKQLDYLVRPETFTQDSLEYVQKLEELKADEDVSYLFAVEEELDTSKTKMDSVAMVAALDSIGALKRFDSLYIKTQLDSLEMTTMLDSIKFAENEKILNERRQQQQRPVDPGEQGGKEGGETTAGQDTSALSRLVKPVKSGIPADSLRKILAGIKYNLANLFLTELDLPDSAFYYYSNLLEEHPDSKYEAQTKYALGTYYQSRGDSVKADSLFNVVYDNYKTESIVNAAAAQLGKPLINLSYDPAEDLFVEAEKIMLQENYDSSLVSYYNIFEQYPESPYAAKALYAGGWVLENELRLPDSAAVLYDSIVANYPNSQYSIAVRPKLNLYKEEKERIKQATLDSLASLQKDTTQQQGDTLASDTSKVFDQINESLNKENIPEDTLRIDQEGLNEYGNPEYFENPDQPADSLKLLHETTIDSLQGQGRRGADTTGTYSPPLDSLRPGKDRR